MDFGEWNDFLTEYQFQFIAMDFDAEDDCLDKNLIQKQTQKNSCHFLNDSYF